ncbi:tryptophan--tRNA ligase, partial [Candidatus Uhrbacteria bacterium]|nr:tryptophan--tRNA ligase [Candidatus Uhrbacteria bacterium]
KTFGETFVIPKPEIRKAGARIMGLDDPTKKMSKSAASEKNFISLMDDEKTVLKKIKSAVTDSEGTVQVSSSRPGITNLITILSLVTGRTTKEIEAAYDGRGYGDFKTDLARELTSFLTPLQQKINASLKTPAQLLKILDAGAARAKSIAEKKMKDVRQKIGVTL